MEKIVFFWRCFPRRVLTPLDRLVAGPLFLLPAPSSSRLLLLLLGGCCSSQTLSQPCLESRFLPPSQTAFSAAKTRLSWPFVYSFFSLSPASYFVVSSSPTSTREREVIALARSSSWEFRMQHMRSLSLSLRAFVEIEGEKVVRKRTYGGLVVYQSSPS